MNNTNRPLRLGSLELLSDRLIRTKSSNEEHEVETMHLDQIHRTSVRRGHVLPLALVSATLFSKAVVGFWSSHDLDGSTRVWMAVVSLILGALYMLTRSVVVSVSAGAHTVTERLAGSDARMAEATRFVQEVDRASIRARGSVHR